ncbi:MAG: Spy/CpxP family protein refolding chaperone [Deltaproteobacteria bacterium]|nr:Spy/CpxP family protein refolding chaperone [Deltaproteobacteria bacterium]
MKVSKKLTVLLTLTIIFSSALVVRAGNFRHMEKGFFGLRTLMQLDLTDTQKAEVRTIIDKYREQRQNMELQLSEPKEQLQLAIHAENFSEENVRQAHQNVSSIMEEMVVLRAKLMAELKPVLTADQLKVLEEKRAESPEKRQKRRQFYQTMMDAWLQPSTE